MLHRPGSRAAGAMGTRCEPVLDSRLEVSRAPLIYMENILPVLYIFKGLSGKPGCPL